VKSLQIRIITYKDPKKGERIAAEVREKLEKETSEGEVKINDIRDSYPLLQARMVFNVFSLHPAIAKIAFEYATLKLGQQYAFTRDAALPKQFIFEEDPQQRTNIPVRGMIFPSIEMPEPFEKILGGNENEHVLILLENMCTIFLFGKLFGIIQVFENNPENLERYKEAYKNGFVTIIDTSSKKTTHYDVGKYIAMKQGIK
jgi:hypothetical protein